MEIAFYTPKAGNEYRIVVNYQGAWRPIFWFKVGKDGSVYLGPRLENITTLKKGVKVSQNNEIRINYKEGQEISDLDVLKKAGKISFHASGAIHAAGDKMFRGSLREIKEQQELCKVIFQHPSQFASIQAVRSRDICLNYAFSEECPLQGLVFVSPSTIAKLVEISSYSNQISLILPFNGLENCQDIFLQIVLGHGLKGKWPPQTYLLFQANKDDSDKK